MGKKLNISEDNNADVLLSSIKENEVIPDGISEEELEKRAKIIRQNAEETQALLDKMSDEERQIFLEETARNLGLRAEQFELPSNQISEIITDLSVFVISQEVKSKEINFRGADLVNLREVPNGASYKNYKDYTDAGDKRGFDDVEISDFNQGVNQVAGEVFYANMHIHKGYDILDNMLNDVARTTALFIELLKDLQLNVARPIIKRIYQYKLQAIASPFAPLNPQGVDVSAITPDIMISGVDLLNAVENLGAWYEGLGYASRSHTPNNQWVPTGFSQDLELSFNNAVIVAPIEFEKDIKFNVNAGVFQLSQIDGLTQKIRYLDYSKTFEEYGAVSGLQHDRDTRIYDLFVITENDPVELIQHYEGVKLVDTPKLKQVINHYVRLGKAINKNGRIWKVRVAVSE